MGERMSLHCKSKVRPAHVGAEGGLGDRGARTTADVVGAPSTPGRARPRLGAVDHEEPEMQRLLSCVTAFVLIALAVAPVILMSPIGHAL